LRTLADVLVQLDSREALDSNILRMVEELPRRARDPGPGTRVPGSGPLR
jgi:hypothetical protein